MEDVMATLGWAMVLEQPKNDLPSNTRLHRLLVSLLDIHEQVVPPLHECLQKHLCVAMLQHCQASGTEGPTMVWHRTPPGHQYWEWVSQARYTVITITAAQPPEPWIELRAEAVALFRHQARCLTHRRPGHPNKGPLYMALHAPHAVGVGPGPTDSPAEAFRGENAKLSPHQPQQRHPSICGSGWNCACGSMKCRRWQPSVGPS